MSDRDANLRDQVLALQAEIKLYRQELETARQEMQGFAYSVSHDLKAPLRAIEGFSRILLDDFSSSIDPEARKLLQHIISNSQVLGSQIEDLLQFYRLGKHPPRKTKVNTTALASEVWREQKTLHPHENVHFQLGTLPPVLADPELLRQVFGQLFENALKFTRQAARPQISVHGSIEKGDTTFVVEDNGPGFDMKYADRLFQVFQKLHGVSEFPGNGIGLAIVKRIVTAHGGCVWAEAEPDKGAKFYFSLPQ